MGKAHVIVLGTLLEKMLKVNRWWFGSCETEGFYFSSAGSVK